MDQKKEKKRERKKKKEKRERGLQRLPFPVPLTLPSLTCPAARRRLPRPPATSSDGERRQNAAVHLPPLRFRVISVLQTPNFSDC